MGRQLGVVFVVAVLVVVSGCASIQWTDTEDTPTPGTSGPDPGQDVIGWEAGYWHNESIAVDQSDGLNDSELEAYVARGMARVEVIRDREFKREVPVTVMSREEYLASRDGGSGSEAYQAWNNQVWEGLFIVGEGADVSEALSSTRGSSVAGFYSPSNDAITIITPTPSEPTISNSTLIHELVHALQDQYINLGASRYGGLTQDAQLAADGLIEGEANYVETRYAQRCGTEWVCVPPTSSGGGGGGLPESFNFGLFITIFHPYSDGPVWTHEQVEAGGWAAFERHYSRVPVSTEQIIHVTNETPPPLSLPPSPVDGWERFPGQGVDGADTVGEASIFAMFWYQSRNYGADVVDWRAFGNVDSPYDVYDYRSDPSAGWGNDRLVPVRQENGDDTRYGYVWKTTWDTEADATEFREAYQQVLTTHNATRSGERTWVVPSPPFADAFRVVQNGSAVTIVNGPTVESLSAIHPGVTDDGTVSTTPTTSGDDGAGFGVALAVVAVVTAVVAAVTRIT